MDDQPLPEQPSSPERTPQTQVPAASPSPSARRPFVAWPFLWTILFLEALLSGATVTIGLLYGWMYAGSFMLVFFFPALGLMAVAFLLLCWRQVALRRSAIGWLLLLVHALGTGVGVKLTTELSDNAVSYTTRLKRELSKLVTTIASGGPAADSLAAHDSLAMQDEEGDGGEERRMEMETVDIPDLDLNLGDSQVVDAVFGWRIVVRRDLKSEGISRIAVSSEDRVELGVKDSGVAWTASGPVDFLTCYGTATVALLQVGMCPKLGTAADPVQGLGCEEGVRLYDIAVHLRQPSQQMALPSLPGSADQVLKAAREWTKDAGCLE